jgi:hypothetical protein
MTNSPIVHQSRVRVLIGLFSLLGLYAIASGDTVAGATKRQDSIAQAKLLLQEKTFSLSAKNPFNPEGFGESQEDPNPGQVGNIIPTGPRTARDLLQAIGTSLKPSGFFVLGGAPTLVFGQKRVKAGGTLTITFEGNEYTLEIVSIAPPNFTLRLNREEFTRPIK